MPSFVVSEGRIDPRERRVIGRHELRETPCDRDRHVGLQQARTA